MQNYSFPEFPNSLHFPFLKTSEHTWDYNCIAYAYYNGITDKWLWPVRYPNTLTWYWPPHIPNALHIDSFIKLFEDIGYVQCMDASIEAGYQKIVLFEKDNIPTHAAIQLPTGLWSSKLGSNIDASHTVQCTENSVYGNMSVYMKRPI